MMRFLLGVVVTLGLILGGGAVAVYGGWVDVAADTPHSPLVYRVLDTARDRAVGRQTRGIEVPANLTDVDRIRRGAGNYDAMCVSCHLSPGQADSEIRKGLYPEPPNLATSDEQGAEEAARQFWTIKHGIKASGMPAWGKGGIEDEAIWDLVAFIQHMPSLSADAYRTLVGASDGHSHGGIDAPHAGAARGEDDPHSPRKPDGKPRVGADTGHDHGGHAH